MRDFPPSPSIVVYVNGAPYGQDTPPAAGQTVGQMPDQKAEPEGFDPYRVHREFPERWRAYLHQNFRNHFVVQKSFQVSERTARKWWNGETGANGGHVAVAVRIHPVEAPRMLFAAE